MAFLDAHPKAKHAWMHHMMDEYQAVREDEMKDIRVLCNNLKHIFPEQNAVDVGVACLEHQTAKARAKHTYTDDYLPLHTRDNVWLTKYVTNVIAEYEPQQRLRAKHVENFVANSSAFDVMRNEYEQRVIRAQIPFLLNESTPNCLMDENCCPYNYKDLPNFDQFFRNEVIRSMGRFGINEHNIEIALERNADLWRQQTMVQSFENAYYPLSTDTYKSIAPWWKAFNNLKQAHQAAWLKVREYEYYQDHHEIIDELGLATESMQMKPSELARAKKQLLKFERMRDKMLKGDINDFVPQPERGLSRWKMDLPTLQKLRYLNIRFQHDIRHLKGNQLSVTEQPALSAEMDQSQNLCGQGRCNECQNVLC